MKYTNFYKEIKKIFPLPVRSTNDVVRPVVLLMSISDKMKDVNDVGGADNGCCSSANSLCVAKGVCNSPDE
jgi:hypothetical protein